MTGLANIVNGENFPRGEIAVVWRERLDMLTSFRTQLGKLLFSASNDADSGAERERQGIGKT